MASTRLQRPLEATMYQPIARDLASEDDLVIMWTSWSSLYYFFAAVSFTVWLSILLSRKARISPFNWYVLYLMVPDWIYAALCGTVAAVNASANEYYNTGWMCRFQTISLVWNMTCMSWLNAVIAYELHYMLWCSFRCIRYQAPTRRRATRNSLLVYLWAAVMACLVGFGHPHSESELQHELLCLPVEYSTKSMLFLWFLFIPLMAILPSISLLWVVYDVWRNDRLPKKGQRRMLSIYFFRIWACYAFLRLPAFMAYVIGPIERTWIAWAIGIWGHSQVLVSAVVILWKPDIYLAVRQLVACPSCCPQCEDDQHHISKMDNSMIRSGSQMTSHNKSSLTMPRSSLSLWAFSQPSLDTLSPHSQRNMLHTSASSCALDSQRNMFHTSASTCALEVPASPRDCPRRGSEIIGPIYSQQYEDVPKQSDLHYQFDDELDEDNVIAFHIEEEADESDLPVCPFDT